MYRDTEYPEVAPAAPADTQGQYPEHYAAPPPPVLVPQQGASYGPQAYIYPPAAPGQQPPTGGAGPDKATFCGMKKGAFICVAAMTAVLLGLVIGLGAGLGAKLNNTNSELAAAQAALASATATSSPSATSTSSTTAASATASIPCPAQNGTTYTSMANDDNATRFELHCGIDFSGTDTDGVAEAADLDSVYTSSMDDCMDACAEADGCEGAGWGSTGTAESQYLCYLKANLTRSHSAEGAWCFAVNLNLTTVD